MATLEVALQAERAKREAEQLRQELRDLTEAARRNQASFDDIGSKGASAFGRLRTAAVAAGAVFAAIGVARLAGEIGQFAATAARAYNEQVQAEAQLTAALISTSHAAGLQRQELLDLASQIQDTTGISDNLVISAESVLLTFTKVTRDVFPDTIQVAADMSTRLGTNLQGAILQVGKALNDPIKGVSALQEVGVSFTESQREQIRVLVESGNVMDAQALILRELQVEFGGSAAAARDTLGGAVKALRNEWGDLLEKLGETSEIFRPLIEAMVRGLHLLNENFHLLRGGILEALEDIVRASSSFVVEWLRQQERLLASFQLLASAIALVTPGYTDVVEFFDRSRTQVGDWADAVENAGDKLSGTLGREAAEAYQRHFKLIQEGASEAATSFDNLGESASEALKRYNEALDETVRLIRTMIAQREKLAELMAVGEGLAVAGLSVPEFETVVDGLGEMVVDLDRLDAEVKGLERSKFLESWAGAADEISFSLRDINSELANSARLVADIIFSWDDLGGATEKWAAALSAAASIMSALTDETKNYSRELAAAGAVIGAVVGQATTGDAQTGAQIGEAIGSIVGTFVKRGADRFIAEFQTGTVGQDLSFYISQIEGATGKLGQQLIDGILGSLQGLSDALGAEITVAKFAVMIEDDLVKLFINGLELTFDSVAEALPVAISELLRTSTITGVGDQVRAALTSGGFESFEELNKVLALAQELDGVAGQWAEKQREVNSAVAEAIRLAKEHGLDLDLVNAANQKRLDLLQREIDQAGASEISNLIGLLRQVYGEQFAAGELQLAQTQLLALQILQSRDSLVELIAAGTALSSVAAGLLETVDATVQGLLSGDIRIRRRRGGGRPDQAAARGSFADELNGIIAAGLDEVSRLYSEHADKTAELIEKQKEVGGSTDLLAAALASLDSQLQDNLRDMGESIVRGLSPIGDLVFRVRDVIEAFQTLDESAADFGLTAEQVANTLRDFEQNTYLRIASGLAQIIGDEKLIQELQIEAQRLQIDMWEFEIRMLHEAGIINDERFNALLELLGRARDATNEWEDGLVDVGSILDGIHNKVGDLVDVAAALESILKKLNAPPEGPLDVGGRRRRNEEEERERRRREAEEAAEEWARRAGAIIEDITRFQQRTLVSDISPLRLIDRAAIAEQDFLATLQRAQAGDLDAAAQVTGLFQTALELRRRTDTRGGAEFQRLFEQGNAGLLELRRLLGDENVNGDPPAVSTAKSSRAAADHLRLIRGTGEEQLAALKEIQNISLQGVTHLQRIRSAAESGGLRVRVV